jgi:hypothetical protein
VLGQDRITHINDKEVSESQVMDTLQSLIGTGLDRKFGLKIKVKVARYGQEVTEVAMKTPLKPEMCVTT